RVTFQDVSLWPAWFLGIDTRKLAFNNVTWVYRDIEEELASLTGYTTASRAELLAITYRQLAINHAENQRYKDASRCRYQAMELGRKEMAQIGKGWYALGPGRLDWWYWATSGYGERVIRATIFLVAIWIVFALLYTQVGFGRPIVDPQGQTDVGGEPLRGRA